MVTTADSRRPLSAFERVVIALHCVAAGVVGVVGFASATDPGWRDLQRLLILMLIGLWVGGIVAMAVIARLVNNKWGRAAILLAGPFLGIVLLVGSTMLRAG